MCDYRGDLVTLRVGAVGDCLECRGVGSVERSRTRAKRSSELRRETMILSPSLPDEIKKDNFKDI